MVVGAFVLVLMVAGQAEDPATLKKARALYESAVQAYDDGRYKIAIEVFEEAYRLAPRPNVAYSMAQAYRLQYLADGKKPGLMRALELYKIFVDQTPQSTRKGHALEHIATLEGHLTTMGGEPPPPQPVEPAPVVVAPPKSEKIRLFVLSSSVAGAKISIGGGEPTPPPAVVELDPGRYTIVVSAPTYKTETREEVLLPGQGTRTIDVPLEHLASTLAIVAPEGADITLDNRYEGSAPLDRKMDLPAGKHFVAVTQRGRYPYAREVTLGYGEEVVLTAELEETAQRTISYYLIGAGAAMIIGATVVGLTAVGPENDALEIEALTEGPMRRALSEDEAEMHGAFVSERDGRVTAALIIGAAATLVGGTGALLYFLDAPRVPSPTLITRSPGLALKF